MSTIEYAHISYEVIGAVARICHNRPQAANAESEALLNELDDALERAKNDDAIRVLIIGGKGKHFSSGHDLIDGIKIREFYIALVGALMVTALALLLDALLAFAVWASAPGSGRLGRWRRLPQPLLGDEVAVESRPHVGSQSSSQAARKRGDASHTVEG